MRCGTSLIELTAVPYTPTPWCRETRLGQDDELAGSATTDGPDRERNDRRTDLAGRESAANSRSCRASNQIRQTRGPVRSLWPVALAPGHSGFVVTSSEFQDPAACLMSDSVANM